IERQPDIYLSELKKGLEEGRWIDVDETTISRSLLRRGWSRKKIKRPAQEANDDDRTEYQMVIGELYTPRMLVFLDESAAN
ncbi:hypothetical protein B0H13DRAFT_1557399, partial [Mycena leptocephala]